MVLSVLLRAAVVTVAWLAVTEMRVSALPYAIAAVPVGVAVTYAVTGRPARGRSPRLARGLVAVGASARFVGWVARSAVVGGIDVARRAVWLPRPDVDPAWLTRRTSLRTPVGRVALALALNLTPGTLSARLDGDELEVHVITTKIDIDAALTALETRVAAIEQALA